MSPKNTNKQTKGSVGFWVSTLIVLLLSLWLMLNRQWVIDTVHYWQFKPSGSITKIADNVTLTDKGKFFFYASRPELDTSTEFNNHCERKEANSPILGCYSMQRIYVYDVTNKKLNGMEEVTAAHEMLHAVYERLDQATKDRLTPQIKAAYKRLKTPELVERMQYYDKNEPGEEINELYAILGTEFSNVGTSLEEEYAKYFTDRSRVVAYHKSVQAVFVQLNAQAKSIANQLNTLVDQINSDTRQYNSDTAALSADIAAFNSRAKSQNGFSSQSEFDSARSSLLARVSALNAERDAIEANIARYKTLRSQLEAIAAESDALNKSIDSTLAPATSL